MLNKTRTVLCKTDEPPYGIVRNGIWKIVGNLNESQDRFSFLAELIASDPVKNRDLFDGVADWSNISYVDVTNYLKNYHPNIQFHDDSNARDLIFFSLIQAQSMNPTYWKGGHASSIQTSREDARNRTISKVLERTVLSSIKQNILASAVAPTPELAIFLAKIEALERFIMMSWWMENRSNYISENITPYLDQNQKYLFEAISYEWDPYQANIQCVKVENPFHLDVVLAVVDAYIQGKQWRFYGNGLHEDLITAAEKALLETLQFVPGSDSSAWAELETSENENEKRIFSWATYLKPHLFVTKGKIIKGQRFDSNIFNDKIASIFEYLNLKASLVELKDCTNFFAAYVSYPVDWRKIIGLPIS